MSAAPLLLQPQRGYCKQTFSTGSDGADVPTELFLNGRAIQILTQEIADKRAELGQGGFSVAVRIVSGLAGGGAAVATLIGGVVASATTSSSNLAFGLFMGSLLGGEVVVGGAVAGAILVVPYGRFVWLQRVKTQQIARIEAVVAQLKIVGQRAPFPVREFAKGVAGIPLGLSTRGALLQGMSMAQIHELRKAFGEAPFDTFSKEILNDQARVCLDFLREPSRQGRSTRDLLAQLSGYMEHDRPLWELIIRLLDERDWQDSQIQELLAATGPIERAQELRRQADLVLKFHVGDLTQPKKFSVRMGPLLEYEYFREFAKQEPVEIKLEPDLAEAFADVVLFARTKELNPQKVIPMLKLADQFGMNDCVAACHTYILNTSTGRKLTLGELDTLCRFVPSRHETNRELVCQALDRAVEACDWVMIEALMNLAIEFSMHSAKTHFGACLEKIPRWMFSPQWLSLVFKFELEQREAAQRAILDEINAGVQDLALLRHSEPYPALLEEVKRGYLNKINETVFKELIEYAIAQNDEPLINGCVDYFIRHPNHSLLSCQWKTNLPAVLLRATLNKLKSR